MLFQGRLAKVGGAALRFAIAFFWRAYGLRFLCGGSGTRPTSGQAKAMG
jgi:hypothetical protein